MKRWARSPLLSFILGCVTTVAVAWGIAWRVDPSESSADAFEFPSWERREFVTASGDSTAQLYRVFRQPAPGTVWFGLVKVLPAGRVALRPNDPPPPGWLYQPQLATEITYTVVRGWPLHALRHGVQHTRPSFTIEDGIAYGEYAGNWFARVLPLRPIWPGFAINALIYGVIWFVISLAFERARRQRRRRCGRCPMCTYDLQSELDVGCPECGWNRV